MRTKQKVIVALPGRSNHFLVIQSLDKAIPAGQLLNAFFKFVAPILQHIFLQRQTHTHTYMRCLVTKQVWEHETSCGSIVWNAIHHEHRLNKNSVQQWRVLAAWKVWCWATAGTHLMAELLAWFQNSGRLLFHFCPNSYSNHLHDKMLSIF